MARWGEADKFPARRDRGAEARALLARHAKKRAVVAPPAADENSDQVVDRDPDDADDAIE